MLIYIIYHLFFKDTPKNTSKTVDSFNYGPREHHKVHKWYIAASHTCGYCTKQVNELTEAGYDRHDEPNGNIIFGAYEGGRKSKPVHIHVQYSVKLQDNMPLQGGVPSWWNAGKRASSSEARRRELDVGYKTIEWVKSNVGYPTATKQ
jgi:hypothetical protein